jgi:CarD family transcriptional regulator
MTTGEAQFTQGEWIVSCYHGVGKIEALESKRISDQENTYFRVKMVDSTIWIPSDQIDNGQIRPVTDRKHFQEAVEVLDNPPRKMDSNFNKRKARFERVLSNNLPKETARLIRDLRARRRSKKGLSQSGRRVLRNLTNRFVQEWAVSRGMSLEQARQRLDNKLELQQRFNQ